MQYYLGTVMMNAHEYGWQLQKQAFLFHSYAISDTMISYASTKPNDGLVEIK